MPLFAAPVVDTSDITNSRRHLSSIRREKRKHPASSSSDEEEKPSNDDHGPSISASTNPLSLRPDEIVQYKLAGLELDEELPQSMIGGVSDFPHRSLPPRQDDRIRERKERNERKKGEEQTLGSGDEDKFAKAAEDRRKESTRGPGLRSQHLSVLTAILQKCLQEGDIPRATRAWSMLLRTQMGGKAIDIRTSGYWGIGAELLARSLDPISDPRTKRRWGTGEGLQKAIAYYQTLINLYPHRRQNSDAVGALDFWPAMLGCKIYGIQLEQREALLRVADAEEMEGAEESMEDSDGEFQHNGVYDRFVADEVRRTRRRQRREERRWERRDEIRRTALRASEEIAATLKDLMLSKDYYSHSLRRFRGMLALYVGDLGVPERPIGYDEDGVEALVGKTADRRIFFQQWMHDYTEGRKRQETERALAKEMFDTIKEEGGYIGGNIDFLYPEDGYNDSYDAEKW
jgi:hypothetical protein